MPSRLHRVALESFLIAGLKGFFPRGLQFSLRSKSDPQYTSDFMRAFLVCFAAMMALSLVGNAFGASSSYPKVKPDPQAVAVANKWLSVFDAGNYSEAYAMFPARVRSAGDAVEKQWVGSQRAKKTPLGRTLSRQFVEAYFARTLPGSPDGYYELLMYKTSFQHKAQATEGVTLTKESCHWQVSGYRVK